MDNAGQSDNMNPSTTERAFIVSPYPACPTAPWKLEIRARFAGKKIRRFFKTEAEAFFSGEELTGQIRERGVSSLAADGMTVVGAVRRFEMARKFTGQHGQHMARILRLFLESFRSRGLGSLTPGDLHRFWDRPEWPDGNATRRQAYAYLRIFFNWCERNDLVERNVIRRVDPPKTPEPLKGILSPDEMRAALKKASPEVRAFLSLGGFAGLRSAEIIELSPEDLEWKEGEIHICRGKTGERYVHMEEAFIRHCPRDWRMANVRNWYKRLRAAAKIPRNGLRHSFATYHLARGRDAGKTAHEMGHSSPRMVSRVYALAARRADADAWWGI